MVLFNLVNLSESLGLLPPKLRKIFSMGYPSPCRYRTNAIRSMQGSRRQPQVPLLNTPGI